MFIFKKHLDRRTFLRGVGATVALPLLDAMIPARRAWAASAVPRLAFVYFPHGAVMSEWTPPAAGRLDQLGRILEPLAGFKDRLTIVSGLENRHAYGPVHAITPGTWLSCVSPRSCSEPAHGITADQIAARQIGGDTLLPSIEVAAEAPRPIGAGAWEGQYVAAYSTTIAFGPGSAPRPMEVSPRKVFDQLFGGDHAESSVLDRIAGDTARLQKALGPSDRRTVRTYLDEVRDVERRIEKAELDSSADRVDLMFDLLALAFQADITRVATFMMAAETSGKTCADLGVTESFHEVSHHQNDPERLQQLVRIQRHHTSALASFVRKLAALPEGDASILDRSLIVYGSNMSDSYAHDHFPLPMAVIGGGCGQLRGGQHLRYPDRTPLSNLLLTTLHRAGVNVPSIGDSTGECAEL